MRYLQASFPWTDFIRECVGGAVGLGVVYLLLKFKPWRNGSNSNGRELKAGDRSVEFWLSAHRASTKDAIEEALGDQNEVLREMIRDEIMLMVNGIEYQKIIIRALRYFYGLGKEPKSWIDE